MALFLGKGQNMTDIQPTAVASGTLLFAKISNLDTFPDSSCIQYGAAPPV